MCILDFKISRDEYRNNIYPQVIQGERIMGACAEYKDMGGLPAIRI